MEEYQDNSLGDYSIKIHEDTNEVHFVNESVCPLCQSVVRLFQIHFDEKILMCGNTDCSYPFGITDCHIYKIDCNDEFTRSDGRSTVGCSSFTSGSTVSLADWTEMEKSMQFDSMRSPASTIEEPQELEKLAKIKEIEKSEVQLRKNVKEIHALNKSLLEPLESETLVNEKWIKRIAKMEERSGLQLLKKDEIMRMEKSEPKCVAKLDIKIDSSEEAICVKIGVCEENGKNLNES